MTYREKTKVIRIGDRVIGGGNPILIQSMTNTPTEDVEATVAQTLKLEQAGCEIIRCTVPTPEAAQAVAKIKEQIHIPLVADIHCDYKMAIDSLGFLIAGSISLAILIVFIYFVLLPIVKDMKDDDFDAFDVVGSFMFLTMFELIPTGLTIYFMFDYIGWKYAPEMKLMEYVVQMIK